MSITPELNNPFSSVTGGGMPRRDFLRFGSLAGIGLADILRMQHASAADKPAGKDINCIFIFIVGGMPQQDMWDRR